MIEVTTYSITNSRDEINKDRFLVDLDRKLFVICDGVSSKSNAGEAAQKVIDYVKGLELPSRISQRFARDLVYSLNEIVCSMRSGTTFTLLRLEDDEGLIIHTGDSECYRIKNDNIEELTIPFTLAAQVYKNGQIKKEQVKNTPGLSNVLLESLGQTPIEPQLRRFKLKDTSGFILCSDGANYCQPELMKKFFNAEKIAKEALDKGSRDDITVITVKL